VCTMFMLVAIVSGVIVHKKIFKDFFTFRPGKQQRCWLDAHNVLSVVALPFHVMITYSGLIFFALTYMPWAVNANYGTDEKARQQFIEEAFARNADSEASGVAAPLAPIAPMLAEATHRWGRDQIRFVEVRNPVSNDSRSMASAVNCSRACSLSSAARKPLATCSLDCTKGCSPASGCGGCIFCRH
jgi:uncharacterized iron-regulated membrane protein